MSMTPPGFSATLKAAIIAQYGPPVDESLLDKFCDACGNGEVPYIQDNAEVVVASVSGVTPGGGTSGPGTGTIT